MLVWGQRYTRSTEAAVVEEPTALQMQMAQKTSRRRRHALPIQPTVACVQRLEQVMTELNISCVR